jgi:hypothetical protein
MADLSKDPFEEFEFRPINEGLGFHRKNKSQQSTVASGFDMGGFSPQPTKSSFNIKSPASTKTTNTPSFSSPLPRNEFRAENRQEFRTDIRNDYSTPTIKGNYNIPTIEDDSIAKAQTAVNEILKNLNQKRQLDFLSETEKVNVELRKSRPILFAASLDGMLIVAAFLMSMIAMLTITKVDLFLNLSHPETSGLIYSATGLLFVAVAFIYMVVNRAFVGYTPGEWAFDQRLGQQNEMENLTYIPRIALRSFITIATGFVSLPLLSYLFNKDVAGQISGVALYRKPNAQ